MTRLARARLALQILRSFDQSSTYADLTESELVEHLEQLESSARDCLVEHASRQIQDLIDLGFANKQIAAETGVHPSIVSRVRNRNEDLQMSLAGLSAFVLSLDGYMPIARSARARGAVQIDAGQITVLDLSATDVDTDEAAPAIKEAVLMNLANYLCGATEVPRRELPVGVSGALLRVGPHRSDVFVIQVDGSNEEERLQVVLHEIDHLRNRLASRVKTLRNKRRTPRTRSASF